LYRPIISRYIYLAVASDYRSVKIYIRIQQSVGIACFHFDASSPAHSHANKNMAHSAESSPKTEHPPGHPRLTRQKKSRTHHGPRSHLDLRAHSSPDLHRRQLAAAAVPVAADDLPTTAAVRPFVASMPAATDVLSPPWPSCLLWLPSRRAGAQARRG
jgi:hypothetical protein